MLYASLKLRTPHETDTLLTQLREEEVVTYTELVTAPEGSKQAATHMVHLFVLCSRLRLNQIALPCNYAQMGMDLE